MSYAATEDAVSTHTGSTVVGPVAGTVTKGSNNILKVESKYVMVEDGTLEIPVHQYQLVPALFHSHSFTPDNFNQSIWLIEGKKVCVDGDSYTGDATSITNAAQSIIQFV
jgi:hypothetical protein